MIEINWIPILLSFFLFGFLRELGKDVYIVMRNFFLGLLGWVDEDEKDVE